MFKAKIHKYQNKVRNGKILTITGTPLIAVGGILFAVGNHNLQLSNDYSIFSDESQRYSIRGTNYEVLGLLIGEAGIALTVTGIINRSIGKRKITQYKIKLDNARSGFYYRPDQAGLRLAFKF
jgi:hypothetical protein